jgi:hypothetical protein
MIPNISRLSRLDRRDISRTVSRMISSLNAPASPQSNYDSLPVLSSNQAAGGKPIAMAMAAIFS